MSAIKKGLFAGNVKLINATVTKIAKKHLKAESVENAWLTDPVLKFNILTDLSKITHRQFSHAELNNITTVEDITKILQQQEINVLKERKTTVKERLDAMALPPNMHQVPSKRILMERIIQERYAEKIRNRPKPPKAPSIREQVERRNRIASAYL